MARVRTRQMNIRTTSYSLFGGPPIFGTGPAYDERCEDSLGPKSDHPLKITRDEMQDCHFDWLGTWYGHGFLSVPTNFPPVDDTNLNAWLGQFTAQKIVAATAPLRPSVHVVTDILEGVRDIPKMLKHAGDLLLGLWRGPTSYLTKPQNAASATLAYQFGWAPLLQDLSRLWDFGNAVQKRIDEIGELNSGKTISKRVSFGSFNDGFRAQVSSHSGFGIFISPMASLERQVDCWATVRWSLSDWNHNLVRPTWLDGFQSAYGLTGWDLPVALWKAMPWSWLIDWFANVSDALEVSKNMLFYQPSRINKMWKETTLVHLQAYQPAPLQSFQGGNIQHTVLNRAQLSVLDALGIHLSVPFLDAFKLSVLGSLATLQILRR